MECYFYCLQGCPSCIIIPQCLQANEKLDKDGVIDLLAGLLGREAARKPGGFNIFKEKIGKKPSSRLDIKLEARALEIELKEHEKALEFAAAHWPAVADWIKQHYPARLIKYEEAILAVFYLLHSQTGKPVSMRILKQAVSRCCGWSEMYQLSCRGLRDKGYLIGSQERLTLLPGVQKQLDAHVQKLPASSG